MNDTVEPVMGSEDFAFMLEARPGNMMRLAIGATQVFMRLRLTSTTMPYLSGSHTVAAAIVVKDGIDRAGAPRVCFGY
ncbi:hypothetical protein [Mesorhizobium sp.]|uniref:hypothetical protein n=1 Tax=Mesorhizobium sp. TaxID=1871066 RepID=UPI00121A43F0|nr:hypothetical protein [Mesorhizobium sp.]TIO75331.1 MAG: amidohydrolase [Mesorhizobium sp.]